MGVAKMRRQKDLESKRAARQLAERQVPFKYLLTVAYDGSNYGGYAKQKHKNTIQNVLEGVLKDVLGQPVATTESSRTDAKVHALNQKTMFEWHQKLPVAKILPQLHERLPGDILVKSMELVPGEFHCRYEVANKTYEYTIAKSLDPRQNKYAWYVGKPLDASLMGQVGQILVGTHDFSTFKSAKATTDTSVRTIHFLEVEEWGDKITVRVNADGFLYNMVRLIVKALVDVGTKKQGPDYVEKLLKACAKPDNLESAPAQGLCLMEINY